MTKYINQWHDDRFFYRPQRNECGFREMRVIFQRKLVLWIIFDHLCRTTRDSSPLRLPQNIIVQNTMCDHSYMDETWKLLIDSRTDVLSHLYTIHLQHIHFYVACVFFQLHVIYFTIVIIIIYHHHCCMSIKSTLNEYK